jgi:hypothetical protein
VRLVRIGIGCAGPWGTVVFDARAVRHAARESGVVLTLGYNTALLSAAYRLRGIPHVMNMDGMEWWRATWSVPKRAWLYLNERVGCWLADQLVADHPVIGAHGPAPAERRSASRQGALVTGPPPFVAGGHL